MYSGPDRGMEGPDPKRMRPSGTALIGGSPPTSGFASQQQGGGATRGGLQPSKVVQIRGLPDQVVEADLLDACAQFGAVAYVSLTGRGTSLLEFENQRSAEDCVTYNSTTDVFVLQQPAYFIFAPVDTIPRKGLESATPSNVLVLCVLNARYPITTDVMSAIFKPIAQPSRIVITRRQGVQVIAEFRDADTARGVKQRLNGCDIYSGCCTLKIEFAKLSRLNVKRNDQDEWDYVGAGPDMARGGGGDEIGYDEFGRPIYDDPYGSFQEQRTGNASTGPPIPSARPGMMGAGAPRDQQAFGGRDPQGFAPRDQGYGGGGARGGMAPIPGGYGGFGGRQEFDSYGNNGAYGNSGGASMDSYGGGGQMQESDGTGMGFENAVLMVYGLTEKMNCEKLFNILCLYGNVVRVKFLKSKTDAAMVQMGDPVAADRVIRSLNKRKMFDKEMQVTQSKKPYLEEMHTEPFRLPDDSPSYMDFRSSRSNRFMTADAASKNRLNSPYKTLYYFNAPTDITDEILKKLFEDHDLPAPTSVKVYTAKEGSRSSAGLIDCESDSEALEAAAMLNHEPIKSETSRTPYLIKFAFAGTHGITDEFGGGFRGRGGGRGFEGRGRGRGSDRGGRGRGSFDSRGGGRGGFRGGRFGDRDDDSGDSRINGPQHMVEDRLRGRGGGRGRGRGRGRGSEY